MYPSEQPHLADGACFSCTVDMTEIGEVSVRKRRSRQEIKRLVSEFETGELRRSEFFFITYLVSMRFMESRQKLTLYQMPPVSAGINTWPLSRSQSIE